MQQSDFSESRQAGCQIVAAQISADLQIFLHGQVGEDAASFGNHADAFRDDGLRVLTTGDVAVGSDRALLDRYEPADGAAGRAYPGKLRRSPHSGPPGRRQPGTAFGQSCFRQPVPDAGTARIGGRAGRRRPDRRLEEGFLGPL